MIVNYNRSAFIVYITDYFSVDRLCSALVCNTEMSAGSGGGVEGTTSKSDNSSVL